MKRLIFFGVGVAVGSAVTYFAVKKHFQNLAFSEINEVRDMYKKKYAAKDLIEKNSEEKAKMMEKIGDFNTKLPKLPQENDENDEKNGSKMSKTAKTDAKLEYSTIIDRYSGKEKDDHFNVFSNPPREDQIDNGADEDLDDDDPYEFIVDRTPPSEGLSDTPFMISEDEFSSEKLFYDKVIIEYYEDGVAVLEETDEILEDPIEDLIGPYILDRPIEEDAIYVRNDNRSTDYGIIFKDKPFVSEEGLN